MAPRFPVASRIRVQTKKKDHFTRCSSKAEHNRRKGRSGAEIGGSGVRQRASSVSGGLGARGAASDDDHEVIIITDNEDEPSQVSCKGKSVVVVDDDAGSDSDKEESEDFLSDDDLIGCDEERGFGEGNGRSFGSEDDNYVQNVSRKKTPLVTKDSEVDLSSDYLSSSTESSSEIIERVMNTEEYVSGSERDENLHKSEDRGESSSLHSATKNNKKPAIDCLDYPMIDDLGRKENVSWVNEWLLDDVEEEKEEEVIDMDPLNGEIDCPSNADRGNSGQKEEGGNSSASECRGSREMEETGCGGEDDVERMQKKGKAAIEFDGMNAETDVSLINEKGKMGQMEETGNLRAPEEDRLNQSQGKSTSWSKERYGKHVQPDSDPVVQATSSSKVRGRKERDLGMSCSSGQQQKKRKHKDCSSKKASANEVAENDRRANWERARKPWLNKFFKLADFLWGRKESREWEILTKPSEEGVGAHQAEARKGSTSTRDYGIR
ncbi:hypothetical protein ACJRO7_020440 [Eucalyptus globulus]|uniref:Uncharacterized protein n=1 Tax=Eucalyptus globulus TaxID=34317 RepID=A0ABD3KMS8_EUCGL